MFFQLLLLERQKEKIIFNGNPLLFLSLSFLSPNLFCWITRFPAEKSSLEKSSTKKYWSEILYLCVRVCVCRCVGVVCVSVVCVCVYVFLLSVWVCFWVGVSVLGCWWWLMCWILLLNKSKKIVEIKNSYLATFH